YLLMGLRFTGMNLIDQYGAGTDGTVDCSHELRSRKCRENHGRRHYMNITIWTGMGRGFGAPGGQAGLRIAWMSATIGWISRRRRKRWFWRKNGMVKSTKCGTA